MGRVQFQQAVDPRNPFRDLAKGMPERERRILTQLKIKTNLDIEQLFDQGETSLEHPLGNPRGIKNFAVRFEQRGPYKYLPVIGHPYTSIKISILDTEGPTPNQEIAVCQITISDEGEVSSLYTDFRQPKKISRGKPSDLNLHPLSTSYSIVGITFFPYGIEIAPTYQTQKLGFIVSWVTVLLAIRIYGGQTLHWSVTRDNLAFYTKSLGAPEEAFHPLSGPLADFFGLAISINAEKVLALSMGKIEGLLAGDFYA